MKQEIENTITNSECAALATSGPKGLNLVPISVWNVREGEIYLYDFFMRKTAENLQNEPTAVFTCWKKFAGLQIKADVKYETAGADFEVAVIEMKERFPERTLAGLIRLTPTEVYDIAPGAGGERVVF